MEKLSWEQIKKEYDQQWVQLVNYDWPEGTPHPQSGVVRAHAPTRKEFNEIVLSLESPVDAARIFVGLAKLPKNTLISCNAVQISKCE